MTVKQLSELFNVSTDTVKRAIRELYPTKMQNGKTTFLNQEESIKIGEVLRKPGYIQPMQNAQVEELSKNFCNAVLLLTSIANKLYNDQPAVNGNNLTNKQIAIDQHYYTVAEFCMKNKIPFTKIEAQRNGLL